MKKSLLIFLFSISFKFISAQSNTFIREVFPTSSQNNSEFIKALSYLNGNFLMVFEISIWPSTSTMLIMFNVNGDTLWTKQIDTLSVRNVQYYANVDATNDGGCILLSQKFITNGAFVLTKIDSSGNESWSRNYNYAYDVDTLTNVIQTRDSGYAFMGHTTEPFGTSGISLIRVNSIGDTIWTRRYVLTFLEIYDIAEANDGGFYLVGRSYMSDGLLAKTDSAGEIQWIKTFVKDAQHGYNFSMIDDVRNDTILLHSNNYWASSGSILEISDSGFLINAVQFDSSFYVAKASFNSDNRILLTGFHGTRGFLGLLDQQLNFQWSRNYNVPSWQALSDYSTQAFEKAPANFWVTGNFFDGATTYASYIISTDSSGDSGCYTSIDTIATVPINVNVTNINNWMEELVPFQIGTETHSFTRGASVNLLCSVGLEKATAQDQLISIYPNPASSSIRIEPSGIDNVEIEIFNLLGEKVSSSQFLNGKNEITIDVSDLHPGLYFVKLQTENGSAVQKLEIQ